MTDKYKELIKNTFGHNVTAELDVREVHGHKVYDASEDETLLIKVDAINKSVCHHEKYEPIDVIEDWNLDFHCGNAIKHIAGHRREGKEYEDIEKAIWYLERYLDLLNKEGF